MADPLDTPVDELLVPLRNRADEVQQMEAPTGPGGEATTPEEWSQTGTGGDVIPEEWPQTGAEAAGEGRGGGAVDGCMGASCHPV